MFSQILLEDIVSATEGPEDHSGQDLLVDRRVLIRGYEIWDDVLVRGNGRLEIVDGGTLHARSIFMEGRSVLSVLGGNLVITSSIHREWVGISGACDKMLITRGSFVSITGPDGGYDIANSGGCSAGIDLESYNPSKILASVLLIRGGNGLSPGGPLTNNDIDGSAFSGGDAVLDITITGYNSELPFKDSTIELIGGNGGDAPDGSASPDQYTGGKGGGYSNGGQVSQQVGMGGRGAMALQAGYIELSGTGVSITGGKGGDAGKGGDVGKGASTLSSSHGGGGGGGYSGGDGAYGGPARRPALPGGAVAGQVGSGGDATAFMLGTQGIMNFSSIHLVAGNGGMAGRGGTSTAWGGPGGGGYSGGGGGSHAVDDGAPGGRVESQVGHGGNAWAKVRFDLDYDMGLSGICATAGNGGEAGRGGHYYWGPGGGGGYSGGGGGALGPTDGSGDGTDGGDGGPVTDQVGCGGDAEVTIDSPRAIIVESGLYAFAGDGGDAGRRGADLHDDFPSFTGPRGGGAYSAGGGGGRGQAGGSSGKGGSGGSIAGEVGDGGDAEVEVVSWLPSISRSTMITSTQGEAGETNGTTGGGESAGQRSRPASHTDERPAAPEPEERWDHIHCPDPHLDGRSRLDHQR
jgi:hypothetical protein